MVMYAIQFLMVSSRVLIIFLYLYFSKMGTYKSDRYISIFSRYLWQFFILLSYKGNPVGTDVCS